jgi:hypothetical protein
VALAGALAALSVHGAIGYLALVLVVGLWGPRACARMPLVVPAGAAVVLLTAVVHAVFFGAGRYGLVVAPFVAAMALVSVANGENPSRRS